MEPIPVMNVFYDTNFVCCNWFTGRSWNICYRGYKLQGLIIVLKKPTGSGQGLSQWTSAIFYDGMINNGGAFYDGVWQEILL